MTMGSLPDSLPEPTDLAGQLAAAHLALDAAQAREAALRNELQHQVRNTLAITRSVFLRTMDKAESIEDARDHFVGRLDALAHYHARLAIGSQPRFDLETMIWNELLSIALSSDERIEVAGPEVLLQRRVAGLIGLALHELATNSVKFGVLGGPSAGGRLQVRWVMAGQLVQLEWAESGVPIVASAPIGSGFGRDFIENALPYQLNGDAHFEFVPGGLIYRIEFEVGDRTTGEPFPS